MRQYEETKETQITTEGSDISSKDRYFFYTRGRFIWIAAKRRESFMDLKLIFYLQMKSQVDNEIIKTKIRRKNHENKNFVSGI